MQITTLLKELRDNPGLRSQLVSSLMASFVSERASIPVIHTTPGLVIRSQPYSSPIAASLVEVAAAFGRSAQYNPVDSLITSGLTGPGAMTLSLPVAGDLQCVFSAYLIDVSLSQQVAPQPFTLNASGVYEDGSAYTLNATEFGWAPTASANEQVLILVAEQTRQGPRFRTSRLTQATWPAEFMNNGAAAAGAAQSLTVNVTSAPANMVFNTAIMTAAHQGYQSMMEGIGLSILPQVSQAQLTG